MFACPQNVEAKHPAFCMFSGISFLENGYGDEWHQIIKIPLLLQTGDMRHDGACFRKTAADEQFLERRGIIPRDARL